MLDSIIGKAATLLGVCSLSTPFEILKMRMMTNSELFSLGKISQQYSSIRNCFRTVLSTEGLVGFWKGNVVMLTRILPIESINFYCRKWLQQRLPNTFGHNVLIAMLSGLTASSLVYPLDILRQFMNNNTKQSISIFAAFKTIYGTYGLKYFYKGFPNMLLTIFTYRGLYNGTYDTNKNKGKTLYQKAGIAYLLYPIEIVRRRRIIMNSSAGMLEYGRTIWRKEGYRGFYKGVMVTPWQSVIWAFVLMLFDTSGLKFETVVEV